MPIPPERIRKMFARPDSDDRAHDVDRNAMGTHSLAGHSLSDKAFNDRMFARLGRFLPQGAQLLNESTTTGKEKSDGSSC
jgi:hypothetical protein